MIKVSIIVPVYNVEKYLRQCLDSIVTQVLSDIEIICVDDGSNDSSGLILDEYSEKYENLYVIHKENAGYGSAMNVGLKRSTGEYIGIIESDDFTVPNMYDELYQIAKDKELDFVKSCYYEYYGKEAAVHHSFDSVKCNEVFGQKENMNKLYVTKCIWSAIYRRQFLLERHINFLETPGASFQDCSFWFKVCVSAKRGYFFPKPYVHYRIDNENSSVKSEKKIYAVCEEMKENERYLYNYYRDEISFFMPYLVKEKLSVYIWNFYRIKKEYRKEFVDKIREEFVIDTNRGFTKNMQDRWVSNVIHVIVKSPDVFCKYMNHDYHEMDIVHMEAFLHNESKIYLYGTGEVAKYIGAHAENCMIEYVVSDSYDKEPNAVAISNASLDTTTKIFITAKDFDNQMRMLAEAEARGFQKIYIIKSAV